MLVLRIELCFTVRCAPVCAGTREWNNCSIPVLPRVRCCSKLVVWNVLSAPQGQAQYLYNSVEICVVQRENVFSHINRQVVNLISQSPYFPLFPFISLSWREKRWGKCISYGRKNSWQDNSSVHAAKGWWIQGAAEHKVCSVRGRGSQRARWGHLGPGHLGAQGASVVGVVDYRHEQIQPSPPENQQTTTYQGRCRGP